MKQESLNKAFDIILDGLDKANIESNDKLELLMNLRMYLSSVEQYTKDTRVLQQVNSKFKHK